MNTPDVLIIGSGPAGLTAGIYAGRAGFSVDLLTGTEMGGKLSLTHSIENYPGFSNSSGYDLITSLQRQAQNSGVHFFNEQAESVNFETYPFYVQNNQHEWRSKVVIIATGTQVKWLNIPNENRFKGTGISVCAICDGFFYKNKQVAIIGGGNTALYETLYLASLAKKVYLITPHKALSGEYISQQKVLKSSNVEILYQTQVLSFEGNEKLMGIRIKNKARRKEKILCVDGCFEAVGFVPNSALFSSQLSLDKNGYIKTNKTTMKTTISGIFACGDVQEIVYRQAVIACASGARAAMSAERFLRTQNHPQKLS